MTTRFPKNPANGTEVSLGGRTWRYNSTYGVWDKVGSVLTGSTFDFVDNGITLNGHTLSIDTTTNISLQGMSASHGATFHGTVYALGGVSLGAGGITFSDGTNQKGAAKDVATFTIDASSSIATGTKTNALYRIPYNATLTNFDVKTIATGGLTAAVVISGSDFGSPTTSSATGCSLGIKGLTGSSTVFNTASVTAGDFIFLHIISNNSGASAAQAFLSYETR